MVELLFVRRAFTDRVFRDLGRALSEMYEEVDESFKSIPRPKDPQFPVEYVLEIPWLCARVFLLVAEHARCTCNPNLTMNHVAIAAHVMAKLHRRSAVERLADISRE